MQVCAHVSVHTTAPIPMLACRQTDMHAQTDTCGAVHIPAPTSDEAAARHASGNGRDTLIWDAVVGQPQRGHQLVDLQWPGKPARAACQAQSVHAHTCTHIHICTCRLCCTCADSHPMHMQGHLDSTAFHSRARIYHHALMLGSCPHAPRASASHLESIYQRLCAPHAKAVMCDVHLLHL